MRPGCRPGPRRRWTLGALALGVVIGGVGCDSASPIEPKETVLPGGLIFFRSGDDGISVIRPDGSGLERLTPPDMPGSVRSFAVAPDRSSVVLEVLVRDDPPFRVDLVLLELAEAATTNLTRTLERFGTEGEAPRYTDPSWAPDGSGFAVARLDSSDPADWDLYFVSKDGAEQHGLTGPDQAGDADPRWSPDGTRIAFRSLSVAGRSWQCHVMAVDGSGSVRIGDFFQCGSLAWSPDGGTIAFSAATEGGPDEAWSLYTATADGSDLRLLVESVPHRTDPTLPVWSPDGKRLVYVALDPATGENLFSVDADGSNVTPVAVTPGNQRGVSFSPDGTHIVYGSRETGAWELFLKRLDENPPVRLTSGGDNESPRWVEIP